jgi:hypothetical protein
MAFQVETLCRACMESIVGNSMPLMNKKKNRKSDICKNFEELSNLTVNCRFCLQNLELTIQTLVF